jgi:hypothetical protein
VNGQWCTTIRPILQKALPMTMGAACSTAPPSSSIVRLVLLLYHNNVYVFLEVVCRLPPCCLYYCSHPLLHWKSCLVHVL